MIDTRRAVAESAAKLIDREDPLCVLRSTAAVVRQAEDVGIDMDAISDHRRPDRPIRRRAAGLEHPLPFHRRRAVGRLFRPGSRYAELLLLDGAPLGLRL